MALTFHPLTLCDREAMQAVTLPAGRRNCNYTFTNLVGWKFLFGTEVCVLENEVVLRYTFNGKRAYMVCTSEALSLKLIDALLDDSNGNLTLMGLEDSQVAQLSIFNSPRNATLSQREFSIISEPVRNQYDYIYRRTDLATLRGRHLNAKRNHIHRFRAEHPDFEYHPLTPEFFDECRRLTATWQEEKKQTPNQNDNKIEIIQLACSRHDRRKHLCGRSYGGFHIRLCCYYRHLRRLRRESRSSCGGCFCHHQPAVRRASA